MKYLTLILLCLAQAYAQSGRVPEGIATEATRAFEKKSVGISFPPVSSPLEMTSTLSHARTLNVKDIRFSENWKLREPAENTWNWSGLDYRIDSLYNAGIKVFLTVESDGPAWRCGVKNSRSCVYTDLNAFRAYVDTLVKRYAGKISYIQFGNESYSSYWYAGTALEFIAASNAFYDAVKNANPSLKVILSGMQISLIHTLSVCQAEKIIPTRSSSGSLVPTATWCADPINLDMVQRFNLITSACKYDAVDVHLYDNVEYWFDYLETVRDLLPGKTFFASEVGTPNKRYEPTDTTFHAARFAKLLSTIPLLKLNKAYYFKLVEYPAVDNAEHERSGLITHPDLVLKPAYNLLKNYNTTP